MIEKLTVVFFILLTLMVGVWLVLFPWMDFGRLSWNENFLLSFAAQNLGLTFLPALVASGWFRGAVSGLGVLNLFFAFWEMANFKRAVASLGGNAAAAAVLPPPHVSRRADEKS